jgi:Ca-activated chloride channel homolog
VFTVALGTKNGTLGFGGGPYGGYGFGGTFGGQGQGRFPVRPDPATLAAIARVTDGQSYQAKTASKVQDVYKQLGASIATRTKPHEITSWFAGAAALLLFGALGLARVTGERLP